MEETKIIYHIDDEDTPYLIKLPIPADRVNLGDFKNALNRPNYKFFFKSMDDDFGVVKEEIIDEDTHLPCFNGRVVSWLVPADSTGSDGQSERSESQAGDLPGERIGERIGGIGDSRPPSFHANPVSRDLASCDTCTETDSVSSRPAFQQELSNEYTEITLAQQSQQSHEHPPHKYGGQYGHPHPQPHRTNGQNARMNGPPPPHNKHLRHVLPAGAAHPHGGHRVHGFDAASSVMSSDLESTSYFDSEDDGSSRFTSASESVYSKYGRQRRRRKRHRLPPISRASSFSSITDSTMSLNIITVTLNMDTVNFLGISIVGQSNKAGDGGIYVGSIMKGGAVAQDGRVEPGDMILEVNGVSFENMSNDDAVRTLREAVQKPGPVTLVVAKCWDPNPKGYFTIPRQEPVRPIDPSAWVAHTNAMQHRPDYTSASSVTNSTLTSTSSSLNSSLPESERFDNLNLTVNTDMVTVVKAMAQADSGLEIRDRMWLKITIPNAFIGSDLVDWLHSHVEGFADRRDSRKYATNLLKAGYIRHTVNKVTFSEQCYYVFGELCGVPDMSYDNGMLSAMGSNLIPSINTNMSSLTIEDIDSVSEIDRDTLAPLPAWNQNHYNPYGPTYVPPPPAPMPNYAPLPNKPCYQQQAGMPMPGQPPQPGGQPGMPGYANDNASYVSMPGANGSVLSYQSGSAPARTVKTLPLSTLIKSADEGTCLQLCLPLWKCHNKSIYDKTIAAVAPPCAAPRDRRSTDDGYVDCDDVYASSISSSEADSGVCTHTCVGVWKQLKGSSASGSSQNRQKADKSSDKKSISESGSETDASSLALYPPQTTNLQPSHVNLPTTTGQNIPGQNIPGQNLPGQNLPGQNLPGQNLPGQMHGQGSMPDMSTIPAYARGPPGGPPVPMPGHPAPGHPTDSAPPPGQLANTNADLASSRQSFKMAMGNPYAEDTLHDMGDL